jgi:hypothetical protein
MKTLSELITELRAIDPNTPGNTALFEKLLSEVIALRTSESIMPLLQLFRDDSQHDELMFSFIHGIEVFDNQTYVSRILRATPSLCSESPRWASIIFMRMLNSEATRSELIRQLRSTEPRVKTAIKALMQKINSRNAKFHAKTTAVIAAAS